MSTQSATRNSPVSRLNQARGFVTQYYYTAASILLLLLTAYGFRKFYLHGTDSLGAPITPSLLTLVVIHTVIFSAWIILFVVQPLVVAKGNRRLHMTLGKFGVLLAIAIVVAGMALAIASTLTKPDQVFGLLGVKRTQQFMIPFANMIHFVTFATLGIVYRKKPEMHRPMMLLATITIVMAALARFTNQSLSGTYVWTYLGPFASPLILGAFLLFIHWLATRHRSHWFAAGMLFSIVTSALAYRVMKSELWERFTTWLFT